MSRRLLRRTTTAGAALLLLGGLAACTSTPAASPSASRSTSTALSAPESAAEPTQTPAPGAADIAITHIHAAVRDPKTGDLLLATHQGLFRQTQSELEQVGPAIDLMGFTTGPDGTFYASGHPGPGTDLPQPVGLISSRDSGRTWQIASRGGESDFHALTVGPTRVTGFDGALRTTADRRSWMTRSIASPPRTLAASPQSGILLATTAAGLLRSDDDAATWRTLTPPEAAVLVTWADEKTVVAATVTGRLATSSDAGSTWALGPKSIGTVEALSAQRTMDDQLEAIAVVDAKVVRTTDAGATTEVLIQ